MRSHLSVCVASAILSCFILHPTKLIASAASAPPDACFYALDSKADRVLRIASAQSVYTACGVVLKPSASDGFEMEGSEALYLANYAQAGAVGGKQPNWQTHFNTCTNSGGDVQKDQVTHPEPYDHDFRFCLNSALQLHERRIA